MFAMIQEAPKLSLRTQGDLQTMWAVKSRTLHTCLVNRLPRWLSGKESVCQCRRHKRHEFDPWVGKIPWNRKWQPTPVFLPEKSHGQRILGGSGGSRGWVQSIGSQRLRHDSACMHLPSAFTTHLPSACTTWKDLWKKCHCPQSPPARNLWEPLTLWLGVQVTPGDGCFNQHSRWF